MGSSTLTMPQPLRNPLVKNTLIGIVILMLTVGTMTLLRANQNTPLVPENYVIPKSPEIEERFGVRFTFVATTASSGFIDLRYRVVDTGKARNFGHYTETSPMLINEDTGAVIDVTRMGLHNHRVEPGRIYYVLFRNTNSGVQRGDRITIQVGDLKLEHVIAQ
jgi:hypothetical protein